MSATYEQALQRAKRLHDRAANQDEYEQDCSYLSCADALVVAAIISWPSTLMVGWNLAAPVKESLDSMASICATDAWEGKSRRGIDVDCDSPRDNTSRSWSIAMEVQP